MIRRAAFGANLALAVVYTATGYGLIGALHAAAAGMLAPIAYPRWFA